MWFSRIQATKGVLILILLLVYSSGCIDNEGSSGDGQQSVTIWITIDFGNGTRLDYNITTLNNTVFGVLKDACSPAYANLTLEYHTDARYGVFVDSIGGLEMKQVNGTYYYWGYWVDGQYGMKASDKEVVSNGQHVEWKYTS